MAEKAEKKTETNAYNVGFTKENNPDGMIQRTLIIFSLMRFSVASSVKFLAALNVLV